MLFDDENTPRSLRDLDAIARRIQQLHEPHIIKLTQYVSDLRLKEPSWEFPDFDPCDGGQDADILFLLEKPGPKTSLRGGGSGFISRNNNDATAEALFNFMNVASIPRERTILWNSIPGWNGTIKMAPNEVSSGINELVHLLGLLPNIRTVVMVGRKAERARAILEDRKLRLLTSAHPSPKVRALNRDKWDLIPTQWKEALTIA